MANRNQGLSFQDHWIYTNSRNYSSEGLRSFPQKHKDLVQSLPLRTHKKPDTEVCPCYPSTEELETSRCLGLTGWIAKPTW